MKYKRNPEYENINIKDKINDICRETKNQTEAKQIKKRISLVVQLMNQYIMSLKDFPESLCDNKEIVKKAIKEKVDDFQYVSPRLKNDIFFIEELMLINPKIIMYVDSQLYNEEFILKNINNYPLLYNILSEELRSNRNICEICFDKNPMLLEFATEIIKEDEEIVKKCFIKKIESIQFASKKLLSNKQFILSLLSDKYYDCDYLFNFIDSDLKRDLNFLNSAMSKNGNVFKYIDSSLQNSLSFILRNFNNIKMSKHIYYQKSLNFYDFLSNDFINNADNMLALLAIDSSSIEYIGEELKQNKIFAKKAIIKSSSFFKHFSDDIQNDKTIALLAISQTPSIFEQLPIQLREDKDFATMAIMSNYKNYKSLPQSLKSDKNLLILALIQDGYKETAELLTYANDSLSKNKINILELIGINPHIYTYLSSEEKNDKDMGIEVIKINGGLFPNLDESLRNNIYILRELLQKKEMISIANHYMGNDLKNDIGVLNEENYLDVINNYISKIELLNKLDKVLQGNQTQRKMKL